MAETNSPAGEPHRLTSRPDLPETLARSLCDQAHALQKKGPAHLVDAIGLYRQALRCDPNCAETYYGLGEIARVFMGRPREAVRYYATALVLEPDHVVAETCLTYVFQELCDWGELALLWERQRQRLRETPSSLLPPLAVVFMPSTAEEQLLAARAVAAHIREAGRPVRERLAFQFPRRRTPRLRIGYLSGHFHNMATACLIAELFELHDRSRFEIFGDSYGPDDGSPIRQRLLRACDRFVEIASAEVAAAARQIFADGVDVLVDLMGYLAFARPEILALRPAPVLVNYLGHPGTTGGLADYIVVDPFVVPVGQEQYFSERCVFLPDCYQVNDRQRPIAETCPTRTECGLPEGGFVFSSFNNPYKISPAMFDTWMRLLQAVPGSVLWLLMTTPETVSNLRREAATWGVTPASLVFAPRQPVADHLARHRLADLGLDTFPVNGHTTTSDALWAGLPVVTCAGDTFVSRVTGSLLNAIGLPELVTSSPAEYEARALHLVRNPAVLGELRKRLAANRATAPLFDTPRYTRHLERAYERMWERHLRGEPPARIEVPALEDPGGRREGQGETGPCWAGVSRAA